MKESGSGRSRDKPDEEALRRAAKKERRLNEMQAVEDYENLCRAFRKQADEHGFHFICDIWLVNDRTGKVHKGG